MEYQVLPAAENDKTPMRVLLVGARKQMIERFVAALHAIGIEPSLVETQGIALMRSLNLIERIPIPW